MVRFPNSRRRVEEDSEPAADHEITLRLKDIAEGEAFGAKIGKADIAGRNGPVLSRARAVDFSLVCEMPKTSGRPVSA